MSKQTKIIQLVSQSSDLDKISELTQGIIGKMCWSARLGYGDELKLDMGKRIPNKTLRDSGEWRLGSRATDWILRHQDEIVLTSANEVEVINREIKVIEQSPILAFETLYPSLGLAMTFANGYVFSINPKKEDDDYEVAYWELFTPYEMLLEVGWGSRWTWSSFDEPVGDRFLQK